MYNKMTSEKCHNVISFKISLENHRGKIDAPNIHLHDPVFLFCFLQHTMLLSQLQSNLYEEVTFETKKKWSFKTGDLLKEGQFI
jgi:hypothetical protein